MGNRGVAFPEFSISYRRMGVTAIRGISDYNEGSGGVDESRVADQYREYRSATVGLKRQMDKKKAKAWEKLLGTIEKDPWARPLLRSR